MLTSTSITFFFFNDTATTEIYTLSLHDALPISIFRKLTVEENIAAVLEMTTLSKREQREKLEDLLDEFRLHHVRDRKSTRLNSSHANISYAVFCLKKKKKNSL